MTDLALALDGSTYSASVALLRDGALVASGEVDGTEAKGAGKGEALAPLIARLLEENGVAASDITTIICGAGPGSFTSLRVAASIAKGIAYAAKAKMYAVSSLLLNSRSAEAIKDGDYLSVLPAMRGELFALPVSVRRGVPESDAAGYTIVDESGLRAIAGSSRVIGPGQEVDASPHARGVAPLYRSIVAAGPIDLHGWEPDYGRLAEAQVKWEAAHGRPLKA